MRISQGVRHFQIETIKLLRHLSEFYVNVITPGE